MLKVPRIFKESFIIVLYCLSFSLLMVFFDGMIGMPKLGYFIILHNVAWALFGVGLSAIHRKMLG